MAQQLVSSTEELAALCQRMAQQPFVTVDTEFLRETTYYPLLCLIQLATPEEGAVIDPLAQGLDLSPFLELMKNPAVVKVFHSGRQDIEIIWNIGGFIPAPVFDTQIAAMVLGFGDQVSYEQLVSRICRASVDKSSRFTDWSKRPLSKAQYEYALSDVTWLCDIYQDLSSQLAQKGRSDWVAQEMDVLTSPDTYRNDPETAWKRIKLRVRKPREQAILMELAAWRERQAQQRNVPRSRILKDEALAELMMQAPTTPEKLAGLRSLSRGFDRSAWGAGILEAITRAVARDPDTLPRLERRENGSGTSATGELLRVLLRMASEQHGVAAKIIASSDDLDAIASDDHADVPALSGWRLEIFGKDALALKHGRITLGLSRGKVTAVPNDPASPA